jgi:hypothetical protein
MLCADPGLGPRIAQGPRAALAGFDLDERDLARLSAMAADPGMATNWTLYRANRLTPLNRILPLTLGALGTQLRPVLDSFWRSRAASLQSAGEAEAFVRFLREQLRDGMIRNPVLGEVTEFEFAVSELRFLSRRHAEALVDERRGADHDGLEAPCTPLICHPLVRVVGFRHDPNLVLGRVAAGDTAWCDFPQQEHFLLLDWRGHDLRLCDIGGALGALLKTFEAGGRCVAGEQVAALRRAGYLVVPRAGHDAERSGAAAAE